MIPSIEILLGYLYNKNFYEFANFKLSPINEIPKFLKSTFIKNYKDTMYICKPRELCKWLENKNSFKNFTQMTARAIYAYIQDDPDIICIYIRH